MRQWLAGGAAVILMGAALVALTSGEREAALPPPADAGLRVTAAQAQPIDLPEAARPAEDR